MLDLQQLKEKHEKAYVAGQGTREKASEDLVFYWITQWADSALDSVEALYRGQFDVIRKAGRQILSTLQSNPVQVDFQPVDESKTDSGEVVDGIYRADDRMNYSIEAYDCSQQDAVVCGMGAWELYTDYANRNVDDDTQQIKRRYIPEAVNTVFFDPNDYTLDKRDSTYCSVLTAYSEEGYKDMVEELTGERPEVVPGNFASPEDSFTFPWICTQSKRIYVTNFYDLEIEKVTSYRLIDPFGAIQWVEKGSLEDVTDELIAGGYTMAGERDIHRNKITKYVASGEEIIKTYDIAGENIPVIPLYGEYAVIEGEIHYEGITRLAKDPQILRNFQMSYLADIVSKSPLPKPIFLPEQLQGVQEMYDSNGSDNQYPYLLQQRKTATGEDLPLGPVGIMPEQKVPDSLIQSIALSKDAIADVADPGLPQDIADPDLSGKAVLALQARVDQQSWVYQHHMKFAKRRDGEIYASMAREVIDTPRRVTIAKPDGTTAKMDLQRTVYDSETGKPTLINDLTATDFDVYADIGPSYVTQKEQTLEQLGEAAQSTADPTLQNALMLKRLQLMDGVNMDDIRDYANKQLLVTGFREPENDEEKQLLEQLNQQSEEKSPEQMLGEAEMINAQANMIDKEVDKFNADTNRLKAITDAKVAGVNVEKTLTDIQGSKLDNAGKMQDMSIKQVEAMTRQMAEMPDHELMRLAHATG